MIAFSCRCKHRFSLPDDQAGGVIQCPECGRLNDVPTLDDLPHLDADGVFDIYADRPVDDRGRIAQLGIIYAKGTLDAEGDEIDMRGSTRRAPETIPLADEDEAHKEAPRPKYDPETGELIRPLELKKDPDRDERLAIPLAQTAISYATPYTDFRRVSPRKILIELFSPANMMVMSCVFVFLMVFLATAMVVNYGIVFIFVAPLVCIMAVLAHLGICVEEIGPDEQDELPRMLRGLAIREDIWEPFVRVTGSLAAVFWPVVMAVKLPMPEGLLVVAGAAAAGFLLLPAVLLTSLTSGTWLNLRPDRLLGVIRAAGAHYVTAVVFGILAVTTMVAGLVGLAVGMWIAFANTVYTGNFFTRGFVAFPLLLLGIYLCHAFAWYLGLMYRAHHGQFPWILQRHVSTRRTAFDPATDYRGRRVRPKRTTEEKLEAARAQNSKRYGENGNP